MPPQYAELTQTVGKPSVFTLYDSEQQTARVLFTGKRWPARSFMQEWKNANPDIPVFNRHKGRNGHPGSVEEIHATANRQQETQ